MIKYVALMYSVFKTDKKQDTPYFSTVLFLGLLIVMNCVSVLIFFDVVEILNVVEYSASDKLNSWMNTFITGTPILILIFVVFPKRKLEKYTFTEAEVKAGRKNIIIHFIVSLIILVLLLVRKGIEKGYI